MTTWADTRRVLLQRFEAEVATEERMAEDLRSRVVPAVIDAVSAARAEGLLGNAWLFGSFSWGTPRETSDIDLLIEDAQDPILVAVRIGERVQRPVHALARESAPRSLVQRVLDEGLKL
jgi:predicted nucleotidyltransferase